ncbi:MAG: class II fructose-bisphosphate aldolase [Verrucomicrobia bacterium]|nr:class II fructose-bisphosphate aldolase [Verrucomicrobiota bacterium]
MSLAKRFRSGVLFGEEVKELLDYAKAEEFALPAINCIGTNSVNAALVAAREVNSPTMIQFSNGGAQFFIGKGVSKEGQFGPIQGGIAGAQYVDAAAKAYGVSVILNTDHCAKKLLPWVDGMLVASEALYAKTGQPLYSSHMLDLSEEPLEENLEICARYFERMSKMGMTLEIELGVTGGEEDGVDNSGVEESKLYTQPEEVARAYTVLSAISPNFTIAAAFGNVHGVYKPGNVKLKPVILKNSQDYIERTLGTGAKPVNFVFHGGSGSTREEIREAIRYGAIKMNLDTDMQWAFWDGVREYEVKNHDYLQGQIGNPKGPDAPNKKQYDPRIWLGAAEDAATKRLVASFEDLNCVNRNA